MYNMAKNVYSCDFCGFEEETLDAVDFHHGAIWECEECGKHFCEKCFIDRWGRDAWEKMMWGGRVGSFETDRIMCHECYGEIIRDFPEKEG